MPSHQPIIDYFFVNFNLEINSDDAEDIFSVVDRYRINHIGGFDLEAISSMVTKKTGITKSQMLRQDRVKEIVTARHLVFYMAKKYTSATLKEIGRQFGRDHTTVMHGISRINDAIETYELGIYEKVMEMDKYLQSQLDKPAPVTDRAGNK